ncbi:hypothetical protein ACFL1U_03055 [Patescibacteria group bacterium]
MKKQRKSRVERRRERKSAGTKGLGPFEILLLVFGAIVCLFYLSMGVMTKSPSNAHSKPSRTETDVYIPITKDDISPDAHRFSVLDQKTQDMILSLNMWSQDHQSVVSEDVKAFGESVDASQALLMPLMRFLVETHPRSEIREKLDKLIEDGHVATNYQVLPRGNKGATVYVTEYSGTLYKVLNLSPYNLLDMRTSDQYLQLVIWHEFHHLDDLISERTPLETFMLYPEGTPHDEQYYRTCFTGELKAYEAELKLIKELKWECHLETDSLLRELYASYVNGGMNSAADLLMNWHSTYYPSYKPYYPDDMKEWTKAWLTQYSLN